MRRDIDEALHGWPYEPETGEGRRSRDSSPGTGENVLQIRIELGLLQLEVEGRPDGVRPHSFPTFPRLPPPPGLDEKLCPEWRQIPLEHVARNTAPRPIARSSNSPTGGWAWLSLQRYDKALQDANHSISLMDFVRKYASDVDYVANLERLRGLVLLHQAQASVAIALERKQARGSDRRLPRRYRSTHREPAKADGRQRRQPE